MKTTKWQRPVAEVGGITEMIVRAFLTSPWASGYTSSPEGSQVQVEVHSYREEGTALVANIGVTTSFSGLAHTKLGRVYL